jgi:hypothetical protein
MVVPKRRQGITTIRSVEAHVSEQLIAPIFKSSSILKMIFPKRRQEITTTRSVEAQKSAGLKLSKLSYNFPAVYMEFYHML